MLKVLLVIARESLPLNLSHTSRQYASSRIPKHLARTNQNMNSSKQKAVPGKQMQGRQGPKQGYSKKSKGRTSDLTKLRHVTYMEKLSAGGGGYKPANSNIPVPGTINISVLGTGASASARGVFVDMALFRYLFNCGEGTQRAATEHKMKISRIQNIFITHNSWKNVGGLLGMILSMDDVTVPEMRLHGPPGFEKFLTHSRTFAPIRNIKINKFEIYDREYRDGSGHIECIPILPSTPSSSSSLSPSSPSSAAAAASSSSSSDYMYTSPPSSPARDENDTEPATKKRKFTQEYTPNCDMSVVYVCRPHPKPGKLSVEKCVDLGVTKGPLFGQLKKGQTITLEDGRQVRPEDVLEEAETPEMFIVLECPSVEYLDNFITNPRLLELQTNRDRCLRVIVHFTPADIMKLPEYINWMNKFGEEVKHLTLNESSSALCHSELYSLQAKLNLLSDTVFPLLPPQLSDAPTANPEVDEGSSVVTGRTGINYALRVGKALHIGFSTKQCIVLDRNASVQEAMEVEGFEEVVTQLKSDLQSVIIPDSVKDRHFPKLVFFGTGSAMPNKVRNVTGILVHFDENKCAMLDCGEGSVGQLYRNYGDEAPSVLRKLSVIFVSHLHADHHMGLVGLLEERLKAFKSVSAEAPKLFLIAPQRMKNWLHLIHRQVFPINDVVKFVPVQVWSDSEPSAQSVVATVLGAGETEQNKSLKEIWSEEGLHSPVLDALDLEKIKAVRVRHRQHPYGIVIKHKDGWQIAFSGDTMKCPEFIEIGRDSDILIHEATMEDGMEEEAQEKMHSTTTDALSTGQEMNAKYTLLTHFSQRYAKVPFLNNNPANNFGIAFDNMHVRLCDMPRLPLLIPALKALFSEEYEAMEQRTMKLNKRKEMEKEGR